MDLSYFKEAWNGGEKLWVIFWIYYCIGGMGIALLAVLFGALGSAIGLHIVGTTLALIIVVPYVVWVLGALWSCAFNVGWSGWGYAARVFVIYTAVTYPYGIVS